MGHVLEEIVSSRLKQSQCARGATIVGVEFCRISSAGRLFMGLVGLLALVCVATFGQHAFAEDVVQEDQRLIALDQKFHADYGGSIQLWKSGDDKLAASYVVKPLEAEQIENAVEVVGWIQAEFKRYPAGFIQKYGPKKFVLANEYIFKSAKAAEKPYSPAFICEKKQDSMLVTVPSTITPSTEILARNALHQTLFAYLLWDLPPKDSLIGLEHWKTIQSDEAAAETGPSIWFFKQSNQREGLFKTFWEPFEFAQINALAKSDPLLKQRVEIVQSFLHTLDPQFNDAFWQTLATIPESQRTICLNDLADLHSADQIKSDVEIQDDIRFIEKTWGLKVIWEPGSAAPPMPVKVRLEYSYLTDTKLSEFKQFIHLVREELCSYPEQIVAKLSVEHIYVLDTFTFRGAKIAGQAFSWLPRISFGYGLSSFDPKTPSSKEFFLRTIHHELFHLIDNQFSVEGGPIFGSNWNSSNEESFTYRLGQPKELDQPAFYKENIKRTGFAERYGMNVASEDRASIYGRMMTEDKSFFEQLESDKILKEKTEKIFQFFQLIKQDLAIDSSNAFYTKLEEIAARVGRCGKSQDGEHHGD